MAAARLLVVDDEPSIGMILARLFRDHDVTVVDDGRRALELLGQQHFDLILCDLMMPNMSGIELYDALAKVSQDLAERMIFMTGGTYTVDAQAFLGRVKNPCIEKPFTLAQMELLVRERLAALKT
jgi:CheY-like chemotaxis protein